MLFGNYTFMLYKIVMKNKIIPNIANFSILFGLILGSFAACKKEELTNNLAIDGYPVFSIRINDQSYLSSGYYAPAYSGVGGGPVMFKYFRQDASGSINEIEITVFDQVEDRYVSGTHPPSHKILSLGKCAAYIVLTKRGDDFHGTYHSLKTNQDNYHINQVILDGKPYSIDTAGLTFNIAAETSHPVNHLIITTGDFSFNLFEPGNPTKLIPATGSFRMYSN